MENEENKIVEEANEQHLDNEPVVQEAPKQEEVLENEPEVEEGKTEEVEEHSEEPQADLDREKLEEKPKEETSDTDSDNDNKENEEDGGKPAEEEIKEEELEKEVKEEEKELPPEQADLIAQLEELRAEKEDREALEMCNKEVMKVEEEYNKCSNKISEALKVSFAQNNIDPNKTLEELKKEDPAKATLAMQFISQAQELKAQLENAAVEEIKKQQNEVIYKVAAREFEKTGLNLEQAKEAVKTFKRIVNEVGIVDLGDDLKMKVQMAAGRAKMVIPEGMVVPKETDVDTTDLKEPSPEIKPEEQTVQKPEEEVNPPAKEAKPEPATEELSEPVVQKPKVEDFEEGVTGSTSTASGSTISEFNVLEELAKLPYKEQRAFYKEHEDLIAKALIKRQK